MSHNADSARLEFVLAMITDIETITKRHATLEAAIHDIEGRHALMMCCMQIGETLNKVQSESIRKALPVHLAYGLRNIIAHDYLGVNDKVIEDTIRTDIPVIQRTITELLHEPPR